MSKTQLLKALVNERLEIAVMEIFEAVEKTITEFQEEVERTKEDNARLQRLLDAVLKPEIKLQRTDAQQCTGVSGEWGSTGEQPGAGEEEPGEEDCSMNKEQADHMHFKQEQKCSQEQLLQQFKSEETELLLVHSNPEMFNFEDEPQLTQYQMQTIEQEATFWASPFSQAMGQKPPDPEEDYRIPDRSSQLLFPSAYSGKASEDVSSHLECSDVDQSNTIEPSYPSALKSRKKHGSLTTVDNKTSIHVQPMSQGRGGPIYSKKQYCLYCCRPYSKISRHLEHVHCNEPEVAKAIQFPKNSKERRLHLNYLRKRGNFAHNTNVCRKGSGQMIVCQRPRRSMEAKEFIHCVYCRGLYSKKFLWKHVRHCQLKDNDDANCQPKKSWKGRKKGRKQSQAAARPNFSEISEAACFTACLTASTKQDKGSSRRFKKKWEVNEVTAIERHMMRFITSHKLPVQLGFWLPPLYFRQTLSLKEHSTGTTDTTYLTRDQLQINSTVLI
ncbi:uncharacterized protein LOC124485739 isoform X1 [Hypomesus transpacificus]|uniref:uncharacterized protein LOC124485739 isoform X1 n=1 Tax=Hypomesus transpacificus TaxID=137520 RepID=UPI001F073013|nr:uncharacterized protein LOC124485739 isoform X1 [Hypomesus transpacificus]